jgi:hypothetical protein
VIEKTIDIHYSVLFDYKNMNKVMRIIKEKNLEIVGQKNGNELRNRIKTEKKCRKIFDIFNSLFEIKIEIIE